MRKILMSIKNTKGFVAVETIIVMSGVLFFFLLFISIVTYHVPRIMLEKEVQWLAQTAKIQGGLTDKTSQPTNSDVELFKDRLEEMGYDRDSITITAKTIPSGINAIGVTPINQTGSNYIKRDSKEYIEITVVIPSDMNLFSSPLHFFGLKTEEKNYYVIKEVVGSERW